MAYRRLVRKLTKENLWIYILSLLRDGPLYGYGLERMIEERFGFRPSRVTCYVVLYRLRKDGYVTVSQTVPSQEGPPRRYYQITDKGMQLLERAREFLEGLHSRLFGKEYREASKPEERINTSL